jgi:hypothetical protein
MRAASRARLGEKLAWCRAVAKLIAQAKEIGALPEGVVGDFGGKVILREPREIALCQSLLSAQRCFVVNAAFGY